MITLVLGGARSGKSTYAEKIALKRTKKTKPIYLATSEPIDKEMENRILNHRNRRGETFFTIEEPVKLSEKITEILSDDKFDTILVECLTVWMGNLLYYFEKEPNKIKFEINQLIETLKKIKNKNIIFVSNETGQGIMPNNPLSRKFADETGFLNQRIAGIANEVYFCVAGIPLKIKPNDSLVDKFTLNGF